MPRKLLTEDEKKERKRKYDRERYIRERAVKPEEPAPKNKTQRYANRPKTYNTRSAKEECGTRIIYVNELHIDGKQVKNKSVKNKTYSAVNIEDLMNKLDGM